MQITRMVKTA